MKVIRERYVSKLFGEDFGILHKEPLGEGLWVKVELDTPYMFVFVEDDEHRVYYESEKMIYRNEQLPEEIEKAKLAVK